MMYNFEKVCEVLKEAETKYETTSPVKYNIQLQFCTNRDLQEKIYAKYLKLKVAPAPDGQLLKLCDVGSCEIGHVTGSEIFRFFTEIFKRDEICQAGNCLYLLISGQPCAGILFLRTGHHHGLGFNPTLVTMPPQKHSSRFQYMFLRLFNDAEVEKRMIEHNVQVYSKAVITRLRLDAKQQYSNFLQRKVAEFPFFPYGNAFLGLMFDCASKGSEKYIYHTIGSIPFAACVKFAFNNDQTGLITKLFGEIKKKSGEENDDLKQVCAQRAKLTMETAKHLVAKAVPPSALIATPFYGNWVAEDVDEVAEEVARFYEISSKDD